MLDFSFRGDVPFQDIGELHGSAVEVVIQPIGAAGDPAFEQLDLLGGVPNLGHMHVGILIEVEGDVFDGDRSGGLTVERDL